ncbi:hypothetical protein GNF80_06610 [Clostridium perfringens]|nr:hypothetical protein [Clostridium perfringens]
MNKIEFYKPGNINYSADGNVNLTATKALFKIQLNGICEIEIEQPYDPEGRWKLIDGGGVIKAPTPYSDGQLFGIYSIKKNMRKTGLIIKARHIIFDLYYSTTEDIRAVNCTCRKALEILLKGTPFTGESNIVDLNTCYFVKMNRIEAINGNKDNTILKRWGGEIFPDNFTIYVNKRIGNDYGVEVTYGKNMLDLGLLEDRQNIVTRIKPVAFNGRRLPELFIDSPMINKYRIVYEKFIEFGNLKLRSDLENDVEDDDTSIIFETEEELYAAMREECKKLFENGIDKPTLTGNVKVAPIENSNKYKGFKNIVNIGLGDTIRAYHSELDIDIKSRCIGYTWNILTEKYEEINIGDEVKNFFQNTTDVANIISKGTTSNGEFKSEYLTGIIDALKCKFRAQRDIAQTQHVRAMLFEDKIKGSATYGAMCLGSMGFQIASRRTPDDKDWEWQTFGTGQGFFAEWLVGKLRTVLIQNMDESFQIDLNGSGGAIFKNNGKVAMEIANNMINLYNWMKDEDYIGGLMALINNNNPDRPVVALGNDFDSAMMFTYPVGNNKHNPYITFDKYRVLGNKYPITVEEESNFLRNVHFLSACFANSEIYESTAQHLILKLLKDRSLFVTDGDINFFEANKLGLYLTGQNGTIALIKSNSFNISNILWINENSSDIWSNKNIKTDRNIHANGDISCAGQKHRIVTTEHYGMVKMNAFETAECYFGDIGRAKLKDGKCIIRMDKKFLETVNTNIQYEVQTWAYGNGNVWVDPSEMYPQYVIVRGTNDIEFGYNIMAKQKGYETARMEKYVKEKNTPVRTRSNKVNTIIKPKERSDDYAYRL